MSDLTGACIFVVEDEPIIALDLQTMLEDSGAAVLGPARTLPEAETLSENRTISLAILDVRLDQDDVTAVADRLAERGIPLIFHTGNYSGELLTSRWPRCKVLPKPAPPEELLAAVSALLGKF